MDVSSSARAPRFLASQQLLNAIDLMSLSIKTVLAHSARSIVGGWRELDNLIPHENHHSSRIMRTYHPHFGVPLGIVPGWWDDRKRNHKPVLPLYLHLNISNNLSRALSCLHLSGHNFLVQNAS